MWTPKRFAGIDAVLRLSCLPVAVSARTVKWSFGNGIRHRAWSRKSQRPAWLVSTGGGFAPANAVLGTTSRSRTPQSAPTIQRGRSIPTRDYIAGAIRPGGAATLLLAPPRDLAVGPLSERSDRPRHAVRRATGRRWIERLDGGVRAPAEADRGLPHRAHLAAQAALPRAAELGELRIAAALAHGGEIGQQRGHVLEVVDRETKRLVSLQEAIEHGTPQEAEVRAAALGREVSVQVVTRGERAERLEQLAQRLRRLVDGLPRIRRVDCLGEPAEALLSSSGADVELAVAAVFGGVKRHGRTVIEGNGERGRAREDQA